jgi:hypothetical protein
MKEICLIIVKNYSVFRSRIWIWSRKIHMFLGLPNPDPLVRGMYSRIRIRTKLTWIRNTGFIY